MAANQRELDRIDRLIVDVQSDIADTGVSLKTLSRRRWLYRPDRFAVEDAEQKLLSQRRHLDALTRQHARVADELERSQERLRDARRAVDRIPDVEAAIARRSRWLLDHPAELEWEVDLAARLGRADRSPEASTARPDSPQPDDELATDLGIDLRIVDLCPRRPRTGIERRVQEVLGIDRAAPDLDIALPPLPGRGIDGPDLGL